ncbi:MAG: metallophosphoesterase [Granulosicoccus sp.]
MPASKSPVVRLACKFTPSSRRKARSVFPRLAAILLLPIISVLPASVSAATKVAFIGDQGVRSSARAVLTLIADEKADIVIIQGDLGYEPDTALRWDENITNALGRDFPVISVVGNHENYEWPLYQRLIEERMARAGGFECDGRIGVKANCTFQNLQLVQVAQGISGISGVKADDNYDDFIRSSFANSSTAWKICSWHMNQTAMQVYSKPDETGWDVYDACLDHGAMIAMGHAHTYSRTYLMKNFETQQVAHRNNVMTLEPGRSFAFVSGLGGREVKSQRNNGDWFASIYTATQGATHGALFCTLGTSTADCYFKAINGAIPDQFSLKVDPSPTMVRPKSGECAIR